MSKLRYPHPDENNINKKNIEERNTALKLLNNRKYKTENTRNLCFVNAAIQTFYRIPDFKNYFKREEYDDSQPICKEISRIFKSEGNSSISAAKLRKLVGESSGRGDISDGSQQDVMDFHDLLLRMVSNELLMKDNADGLRMVSQLYGMEKNEKKFLHTRSGECSQGHSARTEEESFQIMKLSVPESNKELSLNNMISNHYAESSDILTMKCSECCPHKRNCPQTGRCKLMKAVSKRTLSSTPKFLYIQLQRFSSHLSLKVDTIIIPENLLVLPNGEKFKLISIVNHLGPQIRCGHYQALIKDGTRWIKCDDEESIKTELRKELSGNNYVFVYEKERRIEIQPAPMLNEEALLEQSDNTEQVQKNPDDKVQSIEEETNMYQNRAKNDEKIVIMDSFLYVKGSSRFEEVEHGKVKCGGCLKIFARIVAHLKHSIDCRINIDVDEFTSSWTKHTKKRQNTKCYKKKKEESKSEVLKEYARKQSIYAKRKREENSEKFLQEQSKKRQKCDGKRKAENAEIVFARKS